MSRMAEEMFFEVQVRNSDRRFAAAATTTEAVAVRLPGNGIVELFRTPADNMLNGAPLSVAMPYGPDGNGNTIAQSGNTFTVTVPSVDAVVIWNSGSVVRVRVEDSSPMYNNSCGLCADYDGALPDSTEITMNDHWRVGPAGAFASLFTEPKICRGDGSGGAT